MNVRNSNRNSANGTLTDQGGVEKRKCSIEVKIVSAFVDIQEESTLCLHWNRDGKKSIKSHEKVIKPGDSECTFNNSFVMNSSLSFDNATEKWLPDVSTLSLYCNDEKVGDYEIDLSEYIDKEIQIFTVKFISDD